jgi:hypothetical protein
VTVLSVSGCGGGDVASVLLGINADLGVVSQRMQAAGWTGFPSNAVELVDYSRDLAAAVQYARAHPTTATSESVLASGSVRFGTAHPEDAEPMQDCRHAFGAVRHE